MVNLLGRIRVDQLHTHCGVAKEISIWMRLGQPDRLQ